MSLKELCLKNMAEQIKNLPPLLKEEVLGMTIQSIKDDAEREAKKKIIMELKQSAQMVTQDLVNRMIESHLTSTTWFRPSYTQDMDEDVYQSLVEVSDGFVTTFQQQLMFTPPGRVFIGIIESDDEGDY